MIDIGGVSSGNIGKNQFTYSSIDHETHVTLTLLKPDSCYLIKDEAKAGSTSINTVTLTPETGTPDDPQYPYRLYAQAGCAIDTLFVLAGTTCII